MTDDDGDDKQDFDFSNGARNRAILNQAMRELAGCCRDLLVSPPVGGADLPTILISYQFNGVLENHGLAIVPRNPNSAMSTAWGRGWVRSFGERYRAMLLAVWSVQKS